MVQTAESTPRQCLYIDAYIRNSSVILPLREKVKAALKKGLTILRLEGWNGARRIWKHILHQPSLSRREKALIMVNSNGLGLEIGPSHNPIAPKKLGFNVHILDHSNAEGLCAKYRGHGVNLENIEKVDFVWGGESLCELIGREKCYDWIIASHVIEHTPDLISFLVDCERLLKDDGVLSLIIPDKRYCFDHIHAQTSTGEILDAYDQKRKHPTPGKVFDHFAGATKLNGKIAWDSSTRGTIEFVHTFSEAIENWRRASVMKEHPEYIDVHNWRFTPASFRAILFDLQALGLIHFDVKVEFDTVGCEFFVTLAKKQSCQSLNRVRPIDRS